MALKGTPRSFLGINIGPTIISLVELINRGNTIELATYALTDTPADLHNALSANNTTSMIQLARFISDVMEQASVSSDAVVFALPSEQLFSTTIELPATSDKELEAAIFFKAQELIPTQLEEMVITATRAGETKHNVPLTDSPKKCQVTLSGAKQYAPNQAQAGVQVKEKLSGTAQFLINAIPAETINWFRQLADNLHLNLVAVEAQVFPIMRAHPVPEASTIIYVNIGQDEANIYIADNQTVLISRTIDLGTGPRSANKLIAAILQIANKYQETSDRQPSRIYLLGPGAVSADFNKSLVSAFSIPVTTSNPFSGLTYPHGVEQTLAQKGPLFTVAVGLASREMGNL